MSCCVVQRPLTMLVREEKLAFIHCLHYAKQHTREVLLPKSLNLTCKATPVLGPTSQVQLEIYEHLWSSLFIHLFELFPKIYLFVYFLSIVCTVS